MTADEQINEIAELCRKHGCTPEALCASISLNPIPESLRTLGNKLGRAAVFAKVNAILKSIEKNTMPDNDMNRLILNDSTWWDIFEKCVLACIKDGVVTLKELSAKEFLPELYDLPMDMYERFCSYVDNWFKGTVATEYLTRYVDLCKSHNVTPMVLWREKNLPNHFPNLDRAALLRVAYAATFVIKEPEKQSAETLKEQFKDIGEKVKAVSMLHAEKSSHIRALIEGIEVHCLGPINFKAGLNTVQLNIEKGKVEILFQKKDWTLARTEDLPLIEVTLRSLILSEFKDWLDETFKTLMSES